MKYPIAITNYLIDTYGNNIGLGYDIMCAFMKTLSRSSIADKVRSSRLVGVVPAFHGHAHSRSCQVHWHPMYVDGTGLEDFEENERFFGGSNELATGTRTCTAFHRRQQIEEYINFHDEDKYATCGNFLYGNYRQALATIHQNTQQLGVLEARLGTTATDYETYLKDEREYLRSLLKEPEEVAQRFEYLEALQKFNVALADSAAAREAHTQLDVAYERGMPLEEGVDPAIIKARYTRSASKVVLLDEEVTRIEDVLGIHTRWTPTNPEYMKCARELKERKFRRALDDLERLVVQRLLELT
ncbi:hypothetical protein FISHEDRAFT_16436, partial [Fistulina hepatica ATCC 64428]